MVVKTRFSVRQFCAKVCAINAIVSPKMWLLQALKSLKIIVLIFGAFLLRAAPRRRPNSTFVVVRNVLRAFAMVGNIKIKSSFWVQSVILWSPTQLYYQTILIESKFRHQNLGIWWQNIHLKQLRIKHKHVFDSLIRISTTLENDLLCTSETCGAHGHL